MLSCVRDNLRPFYLVGPFGGIARDDRVCWSADGPRRENSEDDHSFPHERPCEAHVVGSQDMGKDTGTSLCFEQ